MPPVKYYTGNLRQINNSVVFFAAKYIEDLRTRKFTIISTKRPKYETVVCWNNGKQLGTRSYSLASIDNIKLVSRKLYERHANTSPLPLKKRKFESYTSSSSSLLSEEEEDDGALTFNSDDDTFDERTDDSVYDASTLDDSRVAKKITVIKKKVVPASPSPAKKLYVYGVFEDDGEDTILKNKSLVLYDTKANVDSVLAQHKESVLVKYRAFTNEIIDKYYALLATHWVFTSPCVDKKFVRRNAKNVCEDVLDFIDMMQHVLEKPSSYNALCIIGKAMRHWHHDNVVLMRKTTVKIIVNEIDHFGKEFQYAFYYRDAKLAQVILYNIIWHFGSFDAEQSLDNHVDVYLYNVQAYILEVNKRLGVVSRLSPF